MDIIIRKGPKIGMGCGICFTYNCHIVSVLTFPDSMAQSLYLSPVVPVSNTVVM